MKRNVGFILNKMGVLNLMYKKILYRNSIQKLRKADETEAYGTRWCRVRSYCKKKVRMLSTLRTDREGGRNDIC